MENHFELIAGKAAREMLNALGYPLKGDEPINAAMMALFVSMAKQIKDLQDALKVMLERHQIEYTHHADMCVYCKQAKLALDSILASSIEPIVSDGMRWVDTSTTPPTYRVMSKGKWVGKRYANN